VEAKGPNEALQNCDAQLAKYFNSTPDVKFAVITNGVRYRFFTDLQERNILDKKPFFEFDFEAFNAQDIAVLERFRKEVFHIDSLVGYAEDLVFLSSLKTQFKTLLREPSDEFVRFAVDTASLVEGRVTQKVVDRFRPLVQESISAAILDIVGQSFLPATTLEESAEPVLVSEAAETKRDFQTDKLPVETSDEELEAFRYITRSVSLHVPEPAKLQYQATTGYLAVLYAKSSGWFARFMMRGRGRKHVCLRLPMERVRQLAPTYEIGEVSANFGSCRVFFQSLEDLRGLDEVFVQAVREVV
jgi:hypothetical protein